MDEFALTVDEEVGRTVSMIDSLLHGSTRFGSSSDAAGTFTLASPHPMSALLSTPFLPPSSPTPPSIYSHMPNVTAPPRVRHLSQATQTQRRVAVAGTQCCTVTRSKAVQTDEQAAAPRVEVDALTKLLAHKSSHLCERVGEFDHRARSRLDDLEAHIAHAHALLRTMKEVVAAKSAQRSLSSQIEHLCHMEELARECIHSEQSERCCHIYRDRCTALQSRCLHRVETKRNAPSPSTVPAQPLPKALTETHIAPTPVHGEASNQEDLTELLFECWDALSAE